MKNIRVKINAEFFGKDYYECTVRTPQASYMGVITKWKNATEKTVLMIKWEGANRSTQAVLSGMDVDWKDDSLELELLDYEDGRPAPVLIEVNEQDEPDEAAEDEEAEEEDDSPPPPPAEYVRNGQAWVKRPHNYVSMDARQQPRSKPVLNGGGTELKKIDQLFDHLLPKRWIEDQLKYTNLKLGGLTKLDKNLTKGELYRWWGYSLSLSLHTGIAIEKMWSDMPDLEQILPPPKMGRHGMTLNRYKKIRSVLAFGPSDLASLTRDPWAFCRPMADAFNEHMPLALDPGWLLTVDESMVAWRGRVGLLDPSKCPFRSYVPRKPEPLGLEVKNTGCALSGLLIFLEFCEGKASHAKAKYYYDKASDGEIYSHTTATTVRLVEPWHGTGRVVAGDSWFSSVRTAEALAVHGLFYIGDIKTNTKRSCNEVLVDDTTEERGAWAVRTSVLKLGGDKTMPIFQVSHRRGDHVHKFVGTCGTTLPGTKETVYFEDDEHRANENLPTGYEQDRKCCKVLNDFSLAQPCIDRSNRYRQFILGMEKRLVTNRFDFRVGTSLMGMHFTNTFFAHRYFNEPDADFKEQMGKLAYRLMHNPYLNEEDTDYGSSPGSAGSGSQRSRSAARTSTPSAMGGCAHVLIPLRTVEGYKVGQTGGAQQRCSICNLKTSWVCGECTDGPTSLVPLCPEETTTRGKSHGLKIMHKCRIKHVLDPLRFPKGSQREKVAAKRRRGPNDGCEECVSDSSGLGSDSE